MKNTYTFKFTTPVYRDVIKLRLINGEEVYTVVENKTQYLKSYLRSFDVNFSEISHYSPLEVLSQRLRDYNNIITINICDQLGKQKIMFGSSTLSIVKSNIIRVGSVLTIPHYGQLHEHSFTIEGDPFTISCKNDNVIYNDLVLSLKTYKTLETSSTYHIHNNEYDCGVFKYYIRRNLKYSWLDTIIHRKRIMNILTESKHPRFNSTE